MTAIRVALQEAETAKEITLAVVRDYPGLGSNLQRCVATGCALVFQAVVELLWFVGVILTFRICCAVKQASEYDRRHRGRPYQSWCTHALTTEIVPKASAVAHVKRLLTTVQRSSVVAVGLLLFEIFDIGTDVWVTIQCKDI